MTDRRLTVEDFARVPWGGMAVHEDGRRAVRLGKTHSTDEGPWALLYPHADTWCDVFDEDMAASPGWRILPTVTPAPVPEPWETAPYVIITHKDGEFAVMKNTGDGYLDHHGAFWTRSQIAAHPNVVPSLAKKWGDDGDE